MSIESSSLINLAELKNVSLVTPARRFRLGQVPHWVSDEAAARTGDEARAAETSDAGPTSSAASQGRSRTLRGEAMRWSYVLRNRRRWSKDPKAVALQAQDATETLIAFGLTRDELREIANAGAVCVETKFELESEGWAARIMPWEYLLAAGTRLFRQHGLHLTVLRHLDVAKHPPPARVDSPAPRVLFVQSRPGAIAAAYYFKDEADLVRRSLGLPEPFAEADAAHDDRWTVLDSPSLIELQTNVRLLRPEIIHIAGCDNHEGVREIAARGGGRSPIWVPQDGAKASGPFRDDAQRIMNAEDLLKGGDAGFDGVLLRAGDGLPRLTTPEELGFALTDGGNYQPFLVCLNLSNSAARTAPLLLSHGALAAVGVQDALDDTLAEYFFEVLYQELGKSWNLPGAFEVAFSALREQEDLGQGSGVALWGRAPFLVAATEQPAPTSAPASAQAPAPATGPAEEPAAMTGASVPVDDAGPVSCRIKPKRELNYSVLHNGGSLFEEFELRNALPGQRQAVDMRVELHCGTEQSRFVCHEVFDGSRLPLAERVRIPLTASLMRSVSEAMYSGLFVEVMHEGRVVLRNTYPLRLLPVDQWLDNASSGKWLPSFVLPRDTAVELAVTAAQRYVRVIRDDPTAGFEGYQEANPDDPGSLGQVDLQVEAIWAALLHEWQLSYINPPPSYGAETEPLDSQRMRTPSAVRRTRMGTCIDLALLFSACLELVDIYPVIFLLKGHALPGYWRHDRFQAAFNASPDPGEMQGDASLNSTPGVQRVPWRADGYAEVRKHIRAGRLVPLETVRLTEHCGFREAMQAGLDALSDEADFECVLDIVTARRPHNVTPLPIMGDAP